ncbi:transcription initiation factor TFIID subunit 7 [Tribolium castaneum]|uniref:Transcription initiation factor TFIID subunit 7-like Protein n=1 Tax=Tribolium castaneum TaxID=7070 RepID=D2A3M0_TRICA|nr:PREDICTED: transcription initiation factor TFIID subunit 7 [Tribolium castaneum]EFA05523.2 Transcription initiation factor TFIID subunit 7-like Protein [Tribolium castaneum]|eukprot:XP_971972.3 PREDICTED: transcription initiation factor TFIID subunit 7 [Tribolium castaneum]
MEPKSPPQDTKIELEDQFILRLPPNMADFVRTTMATKPKKLRKKLKIDLDPESGNGVVHVAGKPLEARLRKLPTIIESLKTCNRKVCVKTADICQILDCINYNEGSECVHGLTPPLKNVKLKRFRKSMINKDETAVNVQKELFYLLQADLEAVSTKFEIVYSNTKESQIKHQEKSEIEIFGNVLTDSAEETESNVEDVE